MRRWSALIAVFMLACSQPGERAAKPTPSPSPVAIQNPSPSAGPNASPSAGPPVFDLPLATVGFGCRLPIVTPGGQGAFVSFPTAAVAFDPASRGLQPNQGAYYDRAFSRWLPVSRHAVSPDGKHFAYSEPASDQTKTPKIHVVEVATGADKVFNTPSANWFIPYGVLDYSSEGIYLGQAYESPEFGLWLLNPSTGTLTTVANLDYIEGAAGNKIFWLGTINPGDSQNVGTLYAYADQLDRYNLGDGTRVPWLYLPGKGIDLRAMDTAGHPIIQVINTLVAEDVASRLLLLSSPTTQLTILTAPARFIGSLTLPIADGHGIWFGSQQGIYLYTEANGLKKVSNQPGYPANGCF
jgi:hypothetical protein